MSNYQNRNNAPRYGGNRGGGRNGPFVPKDGRGSLWQNDNIQSDKSPQFKGSILINGVEYWLNMWEGDGNGPNSPLFSVTVQPKDSSQGGPQGQYRQQGGQRQQGQGWQQRGTPPQQGGYRQGPPPQQQQAQNWGPPPAQNSYAQAKAGNDGGPPQQQTNGHWDENNCWIEK
jgi:hypothetical protein